MPFRANMRACVTTAGKPWKKQPKQTNPEQRKAELAEILEADRKMGTAWVDAVYAANGRKRRKKVE